MIVSGLSRPERKSSLHQLAFMSERVAIETLVHCWPGHPTRHRLIKTGHQTRHCLTKTGHLTRCCVTKTYREFEAHESYGLVPGAWWSVSVSSPGSLGFHSGWGSFPHPKLPWLLFYVWLSSVLTQPLWALKTLPFFARKSLLRLTWAMWRQRLVFRPAPKVFSLVSTLFFIKFEGQWIRVNFWFKKCHSLYVACYPHCWELTRLLLSNTNGLEHSSECADQSLQCQLNGHLGAQPLGHSHVQGLLC